MNLLHEEDKDYHHHSISSSSSTSMEVPANPSSEHICYVRCNFCATVLAVGIPCKRLMDTVTVKCGHCSNLSFLTTRPPLQGQCMDNHQQLSLQTGGGGAFSTTTTDVKYKHVGYPNSSASSSSSTTSSSTHDPVSPKAQYVVKPPEKKHRLPSAYNRFMKEEIQRIKSANPEIPHREAFSTAAKNWARSVPNSPTRSFQQFPESSSNNNTTSGSVDVDPGMKYYM